MQGGDRGGVPSRIKDISLEQFALVSLALLPLVSRKENIYVRQVPVLVFDSLVLSLVLIRRLREYIGRNADLDANLHILEGIELTWHGVGGRTVLKIV